MPKCRRARFLKYNDASSPLETDITAWDHVLLEEMLKSKPGFVLEQFAALDIWCLAELPVYRRLWVTDRPVALRIAAVATAMCIPIVDGPCGPSQEVEL